jgi:hypothetical protein
MNSFEAFKRAFVAVLVLNVVLLVAVALLT